MRELQRIRELVAEKLGVQPQELADDLHLRALAWDSLDLLELAVALEQEFDISLNDERFSRCQTMGEVAGLISAALRE